MEVAGGVSYSREKSRSGAAGAGGASAALVKGAMVLGAAAVVSKLLGTLQKIPLQNVAGDQVFGIYNAVYPLYTFILVLATAGFPIAVSRFVAEEKARGSEQGAAAVLRMAAILSVITGIASFVLLYGGAGRLAGWIGAGQTEEALRSVSFALLFVPIMAALRGYFQGLGNMGSTAVSQIVEQSIRVAVMLLLLFWLMDAGASAARISAGAMLGSAAGGAAGLIVMLTYWGIHRRRTAGTTGRGAAGADAGSARSQAGGTGVRLSAFIGYALPVCFGSLVVPLLTLADTFTVPRLLLESHESAEALRQFGLYNHGLPLVQLVTLIVSSMSVALVPAISRARIAGDLAGIRADASMSIRFAWLIGLGASGGLAVLAIPLNVMMYREAEGYETMAVIGLTAVFGVVQIVSAAIMQGLGAEKAAALNLLAAVALKVVLNIWLVPEWGIVGAAASAVAAYAVASILNMVWLVRLRHIRLSWRRDAALPLLSAAGMVAAAGLTAWAIDALLAAVEGWTGIAGSYRARQTAASLAAVVCGGAAYAALLLRLRAISPAELEAVPKLGPKLLRLMRKWRMISYKNR